MRISVPLLLSLALSLPSTPSQAGTTILDYTGVTIKRATLYSIFNKITARFTLKNEMSKDIIYVQVRCTVVSAAGQMIDGKATLNDIGSGKTAEGEIFFTPEPTNVDDKVSCAPFDLFRAD